jgi:hypothetical protein
MTYFDGATYDPVLDGLRLAGEMRAVVATMMDGEWHTFEEIERAIFQRGGKHYSHPGISARLRDCRKRRFGSHTVERRRRGDPTRGLWEYRLILNTGTDDAPETLSVQSPAGHVMTLAADWV